MRQSAGQSRVEFFQSVLRSFTDSEMGKMSVDELRVHIVVAGLRDTATKEKIFEKENLDSPALLKLLQTLDAPGSWSRRRSAPLPLGVLELVLVHVLVYALEVALEVLGFALVNLVGLGPERHGGTLVTRTANHQLSFSLARIAVWIAGFLSTPLASAQHVGELATTVESQVISL